MLVYPALLFPEVTAACHRLVLRFALASFAAT